MIIVLATTRIASESRDAFLNETKATIEASLAEAGCVTYTCSESITEPGAFNWVEVWADLDTFNSHAEATHHLDYVTALADATYIKRSAPPSGAYYEARHLDAETREAMGFSPASMPGYTPSGR